MEELKHTFLEESNELLASLEKALLSLEQNPFDKELIEEVFRVMHTLKGNSSMFGFPRIAELVHDLETIYDLIRQNKFTLSREVLNCTLAALDHLRTIVHDTELSEAGNRDRHEALKKDISALLGNTTVEHLQSSSAHAPQESTLTTYFVLFEPSERIFHNGTNPLFLLTELAQIGKMAAVPAISDECAEEEIDYEKCYTAWSILLETTSAISSIEEVFVFVDPSSKITITQLCKRAVLHQKDVNDLLQHYNSLDHKLEFETVSALVNKEVNAIPSEAGGQLKVQITEPKARVEKGSSSIRVASDKLNELMNLVSELVTTQAGLSLYVTNNKISDLEGITENVEKLSRRLRDIAFGMTLVPINQMFGRFQRMVRDISDKLGKEVEFVTEGGETELDKTIIETLTDPLMHILRNSLDHGLEITEERVRKGKRAAGRVTLRAFYSGVHVYIQIIDDGKGLDKEAILSKAIEKGVVREGDTLTDKEIFDLIFSAGFSTAKTVTDVSGRGVGMDVVKRNITDLKGVITLDSKKDEGTTLTIRLPLTLSIIDGLLVSIAETFYIIPLSAITKCYAVKNTLLVNQFNELIELEGKQVPFLHLREQFGYDVAEQEESQMIVVNNGEREVGVSVDHIIGEYQAVVKPLGKYYRKQDFASGASILGDGTIALVLDTSKLIDLHQLQLNDKKTIDYV
jgi:two-component system, chemotaxis family, sensor kinase CheA